MNFILVTILEIRWAVEAAIEAVNKHFVPAVLRSVGNGLIFAIISIATLVGLWQGAVYAFGRQATEAKAADVIASTEAIRISIDGSWHWAPAVQAKVAQAWVTNYCPADDFDVFLNMVGQDKVVLSCELGTQKGKDVVFRTEDLKEENLGSGINGLSFLYEVGKVRVTPYQLLSSWVSMLFS